ncbi:MAG: hypothetical protein KDC45_06565 [Bacteroidetes bacterium]|nr:hypothetical protein [Cyclobacteriaceae bacterium]MCB0833106.1 hypothetical protein [Bacteroidota bacterium]
MRLLPFVLISCLLSCAPAVPLSETIIFPDHQYGSGDLVSGINLNTLETPASVTEFAKKKYPLEKLYHVQYRRFVPSVAASLGYANDDFSLTASFGYVVLQADATLRMSNELYISSLLTLNRSWQSSVLRKMSNNVALGCFYGHLTFDAVKPGIPLITVDSRKSLTFKTYGLRAIASFPFDSRRIQLTLSAGHCYNYKEPVFMIGLIHQGPLLPTWRF